MSELMTWIPLDVDPCVLCKRPVAEHELVTIEGVGDVRACEKVPADARPATWFDVAVRIP